jgi:hypothetical protein
MAARRTERRIPAGFTAADLGQAEADASAALISYHSSPAVVGRSQTYVAFALDAGLQGNVASYRWQAGSSTTDTDEGVFEYVPDAEGDLAIGISFLDGGGGVLKSLTLNQTVVPPNPELETMIGAADETAPVAADPETSRELVNDVRGYIDELAPRSADPDSTLNRLIFALAYAEAMRVPPADRVAQAERLAAALDQAAPESFADQAETGAGLDRVRGHAQHPLVEFRGPAHEFRGDEAGFHRPRQTAADGVRAGLRQRLVRAAAYARCRHRDGGEGHRAH